MFTYRCGNFAYKSLITEHPGLQSIRTEVSHDRIYLGSYYCYGYGVNGPNANSVLGCHSSDSARTVYLKSGKRFEIRLNTSTTTAVTSGDRECDRRR